MRWFVVLVGALLLAGSGQGAEPETSSADAQLRLLLAREWEHTLQNSPTWASHLGDRRWNDRWDDMSLPALEREQQHRLRLVDELQKFPRAQLSPAEQLNYDLFLEQTRRQVAAYPLGSQLLAINHRDGVQFANDLAEALRFESEQDFVDWLGRLQQFEVVVEQNLELLREGMRRGILQPKVIIQRVPAQLRKQVVDDPQQSPFYKPFTHWPKDLSAERKQELQTAAQQAIRDKVVPAYRRLLQFVEGEYLPKCYDEVGVWQFPNGADYYAEMCRVHTTTNLTPDEIHEIGLAEVARIRQEMEQVREQAGFQGSLPEYFHYLQTDKKFFCRDEQELLQAYQTVSKRIDPQLVKLFRTLPRIPYGVEGIPAAIAPDTTTAYYRQPAADGSRAGTYFVNLYRPETRPKWEMMALSLHEAVPGHHLQIALASENLDLPDFRRQGHFTAYVEGWALYAESLGEELGLYEQPEDRFGRLTYEMWRAVRLVVDTGVHHRHWSRGEAIEFFRKKAPKMENDIVNEIDRYISWPGQALAYKIGELEIKKLRHECEEALGPKFDIKEFHDVVLLGGAMPLGVLRQRVMAWKDEQLQQQ